MMDYMLPKKVMSWKEAFELYFEEQMLDGLFQDLAYYGITPPRHVEQAIDEKEILSHQVYWILYQFSHAAAFNTTHPRRDERPGLVVGRPTRTPSTSTSPPLWEKAKQHADGGGRLLLPRPARALPGLPDPDGVHRARRPDDAVQRPSDFDGERLQLLLRRLQVDLRPRAREVRQAWLPVHQIYQGNCGGPTVPDVLAWYKMRPEDGGEYQGSLDNENWKAWHQMAEQTGGN